MKKIALILVPLQVCPGESSVSTLLINLAEENEKNKKLNMTIFSKYSYEAEKESKKYPNTRFMYVKFNKLDKILTYLYRIIKKIFKIKIFCLDRYYYKCYKICQKENFDKIITEAGAYNSYEKYTKKLGRNKMVLHLHQDDYKKNHEKIFSRVICVSEYLKRKVEKTSGNNIKCEVIRNGINLDNFKKEVSILEKEKIRNQLNIKEEDYVAIFCGRLFEWKGILELVRSFRKLPDNIKLLVIGNFDCIDGNEFVNKFKDEVRQVSQKVKVIGYVKYNEINQYYSIADLQVVPTKSEEAAGLVAIEGMASGLPVIVTKSGGMVEYVDDKCAIMIDKDKDLEENIAKAILELYHDKERCKSMSEHGKKRAEMFSREKYYEDFVRLVDSWE